MVKKMGERKSNTWNLGTNTNVNFRSSHKLTSYQDGDDEELNNS